MGWPIMPITRRWGIWEYDKKYNMVWCSIPNTKAVYEVILDVAKTTKQRCEWLADVSEKTWATPEILGNLVKALSHTVGMRE